MQIFVNGEPRQVDADTTLAALIEALELGNVRVAVERNFEIVPGEAHAGTVLSEGDRLEVVTFVGGG
ncbi:MAG TPA: sulfur carrier protein ThiS [Planctomycetota bacterium]|nr:sulfur carrier protein ThiS [Planctomycetota bacterium]